MGIRLTPVDQRVGAPSSPGVSCYLEEYLTSLESSLPQTLNGWPAPVPVFVFGGFVGQGEEIWKIGLWKHCCLLDKSVARPG